MKEELSRVQRRVRGSQSPSATVQRRMKGFTVTLNYCPSLVLYCEKEIDEKQHGRGRLLSDRQIAVHRYGKPRQDLEVEAAAGATEEHFYLLVPHGLRSFLS